MCACVCVHLCREKERIVERKETVKNARGTWNGNGKPGAAGVGTERDRDDGVEDKIGEREQGF